MAEEVKNEFKITVADLQREADELQRQQKEDARLAEKDATIQRLEAERDAALAAKNESDASAARNRADAELRIATRRKHDAVLVSTAAQQRLRRGKCIEAVGGNAFWNQTPIAQRLAMQDVCEVDATISDVELKKVFGKTSNGMAAQTLQRDNAQRYAKLRIVAVERGLIGG